MTEEELRELAQDVVNGDVILSHYIDINIRPVVMPQIFRSVRFFEHSTKEFIQSLDIGCLYEYVENKAGMFDEEQNVPYFTTCQILHTAELKRLLEIIEETSPPELGDVE